MDPEKYLSLCRIFGEDSVNFAIDTVGERYAEIFLDQGSCYAQA